MSSSAAAAWAVAAASGGSSGGCSGSEAAAAPVSGASSGFDSDSSPSSVASSSGIRPGPSLGARPKNGGGGCRPPVPPVPPSPLTGRPGDVLAARVSPPWMLQHAKDSCLDVANRLTASPSLNGNGGGDCDQPCNQSGKRKSSFFCHCVCFPRV